MHRKKVLRNQFLKWAGWKSSDEKLIKILSSVLSSLLAVHGSSYLWQTLSQQVPSRNTSKHWRIILFCAIMSERLIANWNRIKGNCFRVVCTFVIIRNVNHQNMRYSSDINIRILRQCHTRVNKSLASFWNVRNEFEIDCSNVSRVKVQLGSFWIFVEICFLYKVNLQELYRSIVGKVRTNQRIWQYTKVNGENSVKRFLRWRHFRLYRK